MASGTTSYVDMGAVQRQEGGSGTARRSYVDMGAAQRQETAAPAAPTDTYPQMATGIGF